MHDLDASGLAALSAEDLGFQHAGELYPLIVLRGVQEAFIRRYAELVEELFTFDFVQIHQLFPLSYPAVKAWTFSSYARLGSWSAMTLVRESKLMLPSFAAMKPIMTTFAI